MFAIVDQSGAVVVTNSITETIELTAMMADREQR